MGTSEAVQFIIASIYPCKMLLLRYTLPKWITMCPASMHSRNLGLFTSPCAAQGTHCLVRTPPSTLKNVGKVFRVQAGSLMVMGTSPQAAKEKAIAMR